MYQNFMPYPNPMHMFNSRYAMPQNCQMQLVKAYFANQPYTGIFRVDEALYKGTVFPNIYAAYPPAIGQFDNRRM
ncbi:spore coat associated protein CotJA [Clostridium botulinum C]|uniref:Spore coat associated protein CotJA n=4 Tax=Clostridium TaxID=1485 RepID=A0A9Q4TIL3_CLOBO|nr:MULTISPECIES: spore coat associated protein CotJA [Clostridium]EGO88455.1 hypothetical protein CBCST_05438 [Clostridium botulinum C str. Stockholm]AYF53857.1 spore coat associated protein CotJA [Clostridium novyi]EES92007.1 conserved hypothetical protein [Clostridium botulinum D str. 1873]KEI09999.1 hypothetical protein Z957_03405 [Clostridium sp. K25]KEI15375.1 hypothetical protein Z960_00780 [Clostridium haemolyticum NCTC 9693]